MGILHEFDRQRGVVFVVWHGRVTWDDWREHSRQLLADPDWVSVTRFIVDLQTVTDTSSISNEQIDEVKMVFTSEPPVLAGKRTAIIATDEFQRAIRFSSFVERLGTASVVFNNLDTACLFLGIGLHETQHTLEGLRERLRSDPSPTLPK